MFLESIWAWSSDHIEMVIAIIGLVPTSIIALYQAKQAKYEARKAIAEERALKHKVNEVSELASKIEREANERESLQKAQKNAYSAQLYNYANSLDYTTRQYDHLKLSTNTESRTTRTRIVNLAFAISRMAEANWSESELGPQSLAVIEVCNAMAALIEAELKVEETREQRIKSVRTDLESALDAVGDHDTSETRARVEQEQGRLKEIIRQTNDQLVDDLAGPLERYKRAISNLAVQTSAQQSAAVDRP